MTTEDEEIGAFVTESTKKKSANSSKRNDSRGNTRVSRAKIKCYLCHKLGHYPSEC